MSKKTKAQRRAASIANLEKARQARKQNAELARRGGGIVPFKPAIAASEVITATTPGLQTAFEVAKLAVQEIIIRPVNDIVMMWVRMGEGVGTLVHVPLTPSQAEQVAQRLATSAQFTSASLQSTIRLGA